MSYWTILVPEATTNLVLNPSAEAAGNFANYNGATVTRSTTYARQGNYAYLVSTSAGSQGVNLTLTSASTANAIHYVSAYVTGYSASALFQASLNAGGSWANLSVIGGANTLWVRVGGSIAAAAASGAVSLLIRNTAADATWYVDAVQVEQNAYGTSYTDGSLDGLYSWTGTYHGSTSKRDAQERTGGRELDLYTDYGLAVSIASTGQGMPPIAVNTQPLALQPGTLVQSFKVLPAEVTLQGMVSGSTMAGLHTLRKGLIDLLKPDAKRGYQPVMIGYSGADATQKLWNEFYYESGLEMSPLTGNTELPPIRLLAARPYWTEDNQQQTTLTVTTSITMNSITQRSGGSWGTMASGLLAPTWPLALAAGPDGTVYLGFDSSASGAASTAYVAKWNGAAWSGMGGSGANSYLNALAVGPGGTVYAGGNFTVIGGASSTAYVAKNTSGSAWSAMGGSGMDNMVRALAVGTNGNVYAGGDFTVAGGTGSTAKVAVWNWTTGAWASMGGSGANGSVYALAVGPDGTLYAGGDFTSVGGAASTAYIAKWNPTTGSWSGMGGSGAGSTVKALAVGADGTVYAGGLFTSIGGAGSTAYVAKWNGTNWSGMGGSGANGQVWALATLPDGRVVSGGSFTSIGTISLTAIGMSLWNGSVWTNPDFSLGGFVGTTAFAATSNILYMGSTYTGIVVAAQTTVTNNGTAPAFPILTLIHSGSTAATLTWLENQSSNQAQYWNQTILPNDVITIDMRPAHKTVTGKFKGQLFGQPLANSDFANWKLLAGANTISTFITGTTAASVAALLTWTPCHYGVDGAA